MKHKSCDSFEMLYDELKKYITNEEDLKLIEKAYNYACDKHFGQKRLTGEDYMTHLLSVAYILTSINADCSTIIAALLHDTLDNTDASEEEIKKLFGEDIASIVSGVTKINRLNFSADSESVINNQRKILVGLSEDVRVIIIKLADRLHNMQTLFVLDEKQQKETAQETLDILTPIAHRLGMSHIKAELEELSLRYLKPDEYYDIVEKLNETKTERDASDQKMIDSVSELLNKHGIKHEIKGRSKSIYSIYKKLDKGRRFSDIYDLLALRVFVDTEQECYQALGIIHSKFKPKPNRFKDYIAMPKTNMYQSLHTTVFGVDGQLYEIQIRTYEMDRVAENGIASHWSYKEHGSNRVSVQTDMEQKLQFFKSIMELKQTQEDPELFVNSVQEDVFKNTIYVFTPKGDVIELPYGSTPIDFAYRVHTKVGDTITGAIVNSQMVPLDHKLENQDVVKIITNSSSTPSQEWLKFVKTTQAKNKIKNFFNKSLKDENNKKGEEILTKELKKLKISFNEFEENGLNKVLEKQKLNSLEVLYSNLGSGKINIQTVIDNAYKEELSKEDLLLEKVNKMGKIINKENAVSVSGIDDIKINFASCCNPVYGDKIVGYITKGNGITIHRMLCPNISDINDRLIEVTWNETADKFATTILIKSMVTNDLLVKIIEKATNNDVGVRNINNNKELTEQTLEMTVVVKGVEELLKFMNDIKMIPEVKEVERLIR
ncbi:MAG: bifunctional (p)ppGpp synthetase/guanosine-3',5'-bis(diphosphate) 3'-pyrophosphohydrolase [Bacilli bacterium]|nr:bifunctional (p)ppGpp synthetase/guanosine-3',5'-bis(diphosphate) 3'-pyrophosphohydrolase [Bacilli bacterium]